MELETGKIVIECIKVNEDNEDYFVNLPELRYNNIRLSAKSCEGIIKAYYKPKKGE